MLCVSPQVLKMVMPRTERLATVQAAGGALEGHADITSTSV